MPSYVIFLRGINVGGHHRVPMQELRDTLEDLGCREVKTFLASGNARFEADRQSPKALAKTLEDAFSKKFGFDIPTIVLGGLAFERMIDSDPFKGVRMGKDTRLSVTFFLKKPTYTLKLPYTSSDKSLRILDVTKDAMFAVHNVAKTNSIDFGKFVEQTFGKNITTRNWNTIKKMAESKWKKNPSTQR